MVSKLELNKRTSRCERILRWPVRPLMASALTWRDIEVSGLIPVTLDSQRKRMLTWTVSECYLNVWPHKRKRLATRPADRTTLAHSRKTLWVFVCRSHEITRTVTDGKTSMSPFVRSWHLRRRKLHRSAVRRYLMR